MLAQRRRRSARFRLSGASLGDSAIDNRPSFVRQSIFDGGIDPYLSTAGAALLDIFGRNTQNFQTAYCSVSEVFIGEFCLDDLWCHGVGLCFLCIAPLLGNEGACSNVPSASE